MHRYFEVRMLVKDESLRIKDIVKQTGYDKGHVSRLRKASKLDKLIADAVAAEREACAKVVEDYCGAWNDEGYALAAAIRARGDKS
jgi:lysine/ornithine N-monooxygenase